MAKHYDGIGELLVDLLTAHDVNTVFGIPGVHTIALYRGLAASNIRHITPRHEQGAGFMADGYARATGKPGVCLCITGPGMTNIITAMGQAFADSIPMLVISSVNKTSTLGLGLGQLHELTDQQKLVSTVAAFSHTLMSLDDLPAIITRAFAVFSTARPRPVHIEIPVDLLDQKIQLATPVYKTQFSKPGPDPVIVEKMASLIAEKQRKVLLVGGGCVDAADELQAFVELTGMPTCLTINARGLLPTNHPLLLDGVQTINVFRDYIDASDLVIGVGTELGETDYDFYGTGPLATQGKLLRIDIDPQQAAANSDSICFLQADAGAALVALTAQLKQHHSLVGNDSATDDVQRINTALKQQCTAPTQQYDDLLAAILNALPEAIIVGDSTKPIYHANFVFRAAAPRRWFNSATGYGTLGYAMPAAIGAKIGMPDTPVVAIAGDGGFQFTLNELVTATQEQTPIAVVVWNNHGYKEIGDCMTNAGISPVGVNVTGPNLELLANAMHARYARALTINDIENALTHLHSDSTPLVVEYVTDIDA